MIKAIVFDCWGTIIENGIRPSPLRQARYFLRVNIPFSEFVKRFEKVFMTKKYESLREAFEAVIKEFDKKVPPFVYDKLIGMWNKFSLLSKPFEDFEEINKLKEKYKLILATNTDCFSITQIREKFSLDEYFEKEYLSCETGILKTDEEFWPKLLKENKLKPEEVLMIGDSIQSDMEPAEKAGVNTVLIDRKDRREYEKKILSLKEIEDYIKKIGGE